MKLFKVVTCLLVFVLLSQCKQDKKSNVEVSDTSKKASVLEDVVEDVPELIREKPDAISTPVGMVWIPGGNLIQGAVPQDEMAMEHEKPAHKVSVDGFFMDITEVTNAQFKKFVAATGYKTVAERAIDWVEMKKQLG